MSRILGGLFLLVILCQPGALFAQEGKLQKIRDEAKQGEGDRKHQDSASDDDGDCLLGDLFGALLGNIFLTDDDSGCHCDAYFLSYPYARGWPGYMWLRPTGEESEQPAAEPDLRHIRGWSGRVAAEESNDFDGINRASLRLLLETGSGWGIQTNWTHVHEALGCGCTDDAALGDVNVTYLFLRDPSFQIRAGVGMRLLADRSTTDLGVNFLIGADLYPCKPIVLSAVMDAGTLGKAGVFHTQGSLGFLYKRWELYTGYDYLRIGSTSLQGPILGLRLWF